MEVKVVMDDTAKRLLKVSDTYNRLRILPYRRSKR